MGQVPVLGFNAALFGFAYPETVPVVRPVFGFLASLMATIILLTSLSPIRRKCYNFFYVIHLIVTKCMFLMVLLHMNLAVSGMAIMAIVLVVWLCEHCYRVFRRAKLAIERVEADAYSTLIELKLGGKNTSL